jgi:hypothetical protein
MFRKLPAVLPIAVLLGALSAAPALAQTHSRHLAYAGDAYGSAKSGSFAPSATQSTITCPTLEGYPDCHPNGRAPWTIYSAN